MISTLSGFAFLSILSMLSQNTFSMDADEFFKPHDSPKLYQVSFSIDPVESFLSNYFMNTKMEVNTVCCNQLKEHCQEQTTFYNTILRGSHTQISLQIFCKTLNHMIENQVLCRINQESSEKIIGQLLWDYQSIRDTWSGRYTFFSSLNDNFSEPSEESLSPENLVESTSTLMSRMNVWTTILHDIPAFFERYQDKYTQQLSKPLVAKQGKQNNVTNDPAIRISALTAAIKTIDNFIDDIKAIQPLLFLLSLNDERLLQNNMHNLGYFGAIGNKALHQGMFNVDLTLPKLQQLRDLFKTAILHI